MVVDKYVGRCLDVGSTPTGSIIPLHSFEFLGKTLLNQRFFLCDFQSVSLRQVRDKKPPAIRVHVEGYTPKNSKRDTIKVFKPIVKRKEKNMAQKAHSLSHTKWHCSITLCSPLSIDEKSSIINIEVVQAKYFIACVVIKELKLSRVT